MGRRIEEDRQRSLTLEERDVEIRVPFVLFRSSNPTPIFVDDTPIMTSDGPSRENDVGAAGSSNKDDASGARG